MNKRIMPIVIAVVSVVVVGGAYYGFNYWRQQQLVSKILKEAYGVNAGLLGTLTGGGKISNQMMEDLAKEAAKQELQEQKDEAIEAAKTPEEKYNRTTEMPTYDANSKAVAAEAKSIVEKVFGKAKLTSISSNVYGSDLIGSGVAEFKIARLSTGEDLGILIKVLTDKGLPIIQSGIENKSAGAMAGSNDLAYTVAFEIGEQTVTISIVKQINNN